MNSLSSSHPHLWSLGPLLIGHDSPLLMVKKDTIIHTWIILGLLLGLIVLVRLMLKRKESVIYFLTLSYVQFFKNLCEQSIGSLFFGHLSFIISLFTFILLCNTIAIIPSMEEPTTDINTTLALGLIAFIYTQVTAIYSHGLMSYIKEYFTPFFIMFPLHVIGKIASIISLSFRLFGNILGGALISTIYLNAIKGSLLLECIGLISGFNLAILIFFGLFEGCLQAFVFTMLSLTYLSIAIRGQEST
jgi:F-type H+-transporting ATPase subunit a